MSTARVVLRGAAKYKLGGITWVKNVPKVIKGEDKIKALEQNGYFIVKRIASKRSAQPQPKSPSPSATETQGARKLVKRSLPNESKED